MSHPFQSFHKLLITYTIPIIRSLLQPLPFYVKIDFTKGGAPMIQYKLNDSIPVDTLTELYDSVEWTGYTNHAEKMNGLLDGSYYYISAWKEEFLVGLIRSVGDGVSILYIQDILVHPDFQRQGIGKQLMERLISDNSTIRQMVLITDDAQDTKAFYHNVGFKAIEDLNGVAFVRYDFNH